MTASSAVAPRPAAPDGATGARVASATRTGPRAAGRSDSGPIPNAFGFGLFNPNDPVEAGIAVITIVLAGAAVAFFTSLVLAAFRARRALQL
jgi:hypothetical protein